MPRQPLDFGENNSPGKVYIRMITDDPCLLLLHNTTKQQMKVDKITLHIDFLHAELYPHEIGPAARGLGLVEFGPGGPQITDRKVSFSESTSYGFVFDMASPYPIGTLPGIAVHPVASTFRPARQALQQAYQLYTEAITTVTSIGGVPMPKEPGYSIPVFDIVRWRRGDNAKNVFGEVGKATYLPVFKLVGLVNHIAKPLTDLDREKFEYRTRELELPDGPLPSMLGGMPDESGGYTDPDSPVPNRGVRRKLRLPQGPADD